MPPVETYPLFGPRDAPVSVPLMCEMLVDQGRRVGGDPVGYKCSRPPTGFLESGALICAECSRLLETAPGRITFPRHPLGVGGQVRLAGEIIANMVHVARNPGGGTR